MPATLPLPPLLQLIPQTDKKPHNMLLLPKAYIPVIHNVLTEKMNNVSKAVTELRVNYVVMKLTVLTPKLACLCSPPPPFLQLIRQPDKKRLAPFDYGSDCSPKGKPFFESCNQKEYLGATLPPAYDLGRIRVPTAWITGEVYTGTVIHCLMITHCV